MLRVGNNVHMLVPMRDGSPDWEINIDRKNPNCSASYQNIGCFSSGISDPPKKYRVNFKVHTGFVL